MNLTNAQLLQLLEEATLGMARLQARQEMLEAVVLAFIKEAPPIHPLAWQSLRTAKSDLDRLSAARRAEHPPEADAAALALWNELYAACAPPAAPGSATPGP